MNFGIFNLNTACEESLWRFGESIEIKPHCGTWLLRRNKSHCACNWSDPCCVQLLFLDRNNHLYNIRLHEGSFLNNVYRSNGVTWHTINSLILSSIKPPLPALKIFDTASERPPKLIESILTKKARRYLQHIDNCSKLSLHYLKLT